jgi:hypothetical protein
MTDGERLYSYHYMIALWQGGEVLLTAEWAGEPNTVKRHRKMLGELALAMGVQCA